METGQNTVTHLFEPFATIFFNDRSLNISVLTEKLKGTVFILTHQGSVADYVGEHNGSKSAVFGHI
jgi:hypothetical protein